MTQIFTNVTLTSRFLDFLGRTFIGSPQSILSTPENDAEYERSGIVPPDYSDFYYLQGDRVMPPPIGHTWEKKRELIYTEFMRLRLKRAIRLWLLPLSILGSLAGFYIAL